MTKTNKQRLYTIYYSIKNRTENKYNIYSYKNYGKRGIKCLWKNFEEFYNDMYKSYCLHIEKFGHKQTSIDRIDNNGNYCKENCRWATYKEQANNRRNSIFLKFKEKNLTVKDWAKKLSIPESTIRGRIAYHWDTEKILTTPVFTIYRKKI